MAATFTRLPAITSRRTAKDEETDLQAFRDNRTRGAYDEWPNEAGVRTARNP